MKLSKLVKQYREEHSLSQRQFSAMCGMSTGYVSMLEEGVNPRTKEPLVPSLVTMRKLSAAMGIGLDELLGMIDGDMLVSLSSKDPTLTPQEEREKEFLTLFQRLSEEEQLLLLRQMRGLLTSK